MPRLLSAPAPATPCVYVPQLPFPAHLPSVNTAFSLLGFPQAKLVRYICKQRQCKLGVAPSERTPELNSYPHFSDWLYTFNIRPEVVQEILGQLTLDALLEMNEAKVKETLRRCGASAEECGRLQSALTCLRKVTGLGR